MRSQKIFLLVLAIFCLVHSSLAQTWLATQRLTWDTVSSENPVVFPGAGSDIHVAWFNRLTGNYEIFYKKSSDSGTTWTAAKRLTWSTRYFKDPDLTVDSSNRVHCVFYDSDFNNNEIFYKRSTNGGTTWDPIKRLTWSGGHAYRPSVTYDSFDNIYVLWMGDAPGNYDLYLKKSTDGGISWSPPKRLTWTSGSSTQARLESSSATTIQVTWVESSGGSIDLYYKNSVDGGTTWSTPKRLTWGAADIAHPDLAIDSSNNVFIAWHNEIVPDAEIFYKKSTDSGSSWMATQRLTWNSGESYDPDIDINSGDRIRIFWRDDTPGNKEIFTKYSTDSGTTWSAASRVTWSTDHSVHPCVVSDQSSRVHLVWEEQIAEDYEIFYKRSQLLVIK